MLVTTIYNRDNAVITGCYYTAKGERINVEYMGTALECSDMLLYIQLQEDGTNEVQHALVRVDHRVNARMEVPVQTNPLMTAWHNPVNSTTGVV